MLVLGVNAYHGDASACLLYDGSCVAAVEEERFSRKKHQAGFPSNAVRWVLDEVGADITDVDHVAISRDPMAHVHRKVWRVLVDHPPLSSLKQRAKAQKDVLSIKDALGETFAVEPSSIRAKTHRVEHHRSHLASAFFCSPFDKAVCLSVDGMGDFVSGMWARGFGNRMDVRGYVPFPHSLGIYYTAFTQFLGLPNYGDEYKLMGLAAYGEPEYLPRLRQILFLDDKNRYQLNLDYFVHHDRGVDMTWTEGTPDLGRLWSDRMADAFGAAREPRSEVTERDRNLAASIQARLEEVELEMLRRIHADNSNPNLVLAGGVALNCVVNGMIRQETPFEEVWVQPAANDSGTSIGSALWVWNQVLGNPRTWEMKDVYLGPQHGEAAYDRALKEAGFEPTMYEDEELYDVVAQRITEGAIIGWFQGRSEMGPRALGNRSIVCDPRRHDMKDILNARIKYREPFRPFAPSILAERTGEWFDQDYPSPWMNMTYTVLPDRQDQVPAITHEDGTGRLQTVERDVNEHYYDLIAAFERKTGVPIVLNTSFNENEPIVNTPEEAVDCFARTDMDVLVLGNRVVDRGGRR